jgi:hypothetical protein
MASALEKHPVKWGPLAFIANAHEVVFEKDRFVVGAHCATDACGLIGCEMNGVFCVLAPKRGKPSLFLRMAHRANSGYDGPSARQLAEVAALVSLNHKAFLQRLLELREQTGEGSQYDESSRIRDMISKAGDTAPTARALSDDELRTIKKETENGQ